MQERLYSFYGQNEPIGQTGLKSMLTEKLCFGIIIRVDIKNRVME